MDVRAAVRGVGVALLLALLLALHLAVAGCSGSAPPSARSVPPDSASARRPADPDAAVLPGSSAEGAEAARPAPAGSGSGGGSAPGDDTASAGVAASGAPAPAGRPGPETRTVGVVADIIRRHRQGARDCFDRARDRSPGLGGDLVVAFELDPAGNVTGASLNRERSTVIDPRVVACVLAHVRSLRFPPSSRGLQTRGNYPFNFKPSRSRSSNAGLSRAVPRKAGR